MLNKIGKEFNQTYGVERVLHTPNNLITRLNFIAEELSEAYESVDKLDIKGLAAELADIIYVTTTTIDAMGFDADKLLLEKHRSNMTKVIPLDLSVEEIGRELTEARKRYPAAELEPVEFGYVLKCAETHKVIRPMCYSKSVITDAMIGIY